MAEEKKGIELVIDRVEALRVRINARRDKEDALSDVFYHWEQLCIEALTELTALHRATSQNLMEQLEVLYSAINSELALRLAPPAAVASKLDSWRIAVNDAMATLQTMSAPPRTYLDAGQWDHITAWLALPVTASGAEVELCIKAAVKRLAELELKLAQTETQEVAPPNAPSYGPQLMPPGIYHAVPIGVEQRADGSVVERMKLDDGTIIEHRLMFARIKP